MFAHFSPTEIGGCHCTAAPEAVCFLLYIFYDAAFCGLYGPAWLVPGFIILAKLLGQAITHIYRAGYLGTESN